MLCTDWNKTIHMLTLTYVHVVYSIICILAYYADIVSVTTQSIAWREALHNNPNLHCMLSVACEEGLLGRGRKGRWLSLYIFLSHSHSLSPQWAAMQASYLHWMLFYTVMYILHVKSCSILRSCSDCSKVDSVIGSKTTRNGTDYPMTSV